jgi:hypothetical protein
VGATIGATIEGTTTLLVGTFCHVRPLRGTDTVFFGRPFWGSTGNDVTGECKDDSLVLGPSLYTSFSLSYSPSHCQCATS